MFKNISIVILFLYTSYVANAQNDFRPGKVFLSSGDTLSGEINYNSRSATYMQFRIDNGNELKTYGVDDLSGYELEGILFLKRIVAVDQVFNNSYVFLETLVPGKAALLTFKTSANKAYYFLEKDNILHYLRGGTIRVYQDGRPFDKEIRDYYGLLKFHTLDCERLKNNFPDFQYNQEGLIQVVRNYNSCFEESSSDLTAEAKITNKARKLFGLKTGANMPFFIIDGNRNVYSPKITPLIGTFFIIPFGGSNKNLSAILELTYSWRQAVPTQEGKERRYNAVNLSMLEFHPLLRYTMARGSVRPIISAGGYCSLASKNNFIIAREEIKNFLIGLQGETGFSIPVSKHTLFFTIRAQRTYYTEIIRSWNYNLAAGFAF